MSLAKNFQKQLHNELNIHAAWMPVANSIKVGTYGLFEGGVLRPMGHITNDFGIQIGELQQSATTNASFASAGVTTIRTVAEVEVDSFASAGDVEAKLSFTFKDKDSVLLKTPALTEFRMESIPTVAKALAEHPDWDKGYRVVSAVHEAEDSVVLLAGEAGTKIELNAAASALQQLEGGKGSVEFEFSTSSERSWRSIGKPGVIGISLFKLGWFNKIKLLAEQEDIKIEYSEDWTELDDDL